MVVYRWASIHSCYLDAFDDKALIETLTKIKRGERVLVEESKLNPYTGG